ncbi:hypothetical protein EV127DRAFT_444815 [Xylaria flabelliformis]|nr:hypothetical protein EV127DRAFT_444815 [Xylaria flabelliformis]
MEGPSDIDYRGIGEGLTTALLRNSSPSGSTVSLDDDWQIIPSHKENPCEPHSTASAANLTLGTESEPELCEELSVFATQRAQLAFLADEMTPLERYCCHAETHEQLVVGQIGDRQSFTRLNELDSSLDAAARLLDGITPQASTSSWSNLSSLCEDTNIAPALELDHLVLLNNSPEWQAVPQEEQAKHLHRIAKLRRRVKAEGNPRKMKSVRVRKRGKNNHVSNEATGQNSAI